MTKKQGQVYGVMLVAVSLVGILALANIVIRHFSGVAMPPALEEIFFPAVCKLPWCIPISIP